MLKRISPLYFKDKSKIRFVHACTDIDKLALTCIVLENDDDEINKELRSNLRNDVPHVLIFVPYLNLIAEIL